MAAVILGIRSFPQQIESPSYYCPQIITHWAEKKGHKVEFMGVQGITNKLRRLGGQREINGILGRPNISGRKVNTEKKLLFHFRLPTFYFPGEISCLNYILHPAINLAYRISSSRGGTELMLNHAIHLMPAPPLPCSRSRFNQQH